MFQDNKKIKKKGGGGMVFEVKDVDGEKEGIERVWR